MLLDRRTLLAIMLSFSPCGIYAAENAELVITVDNIRSVEGQIIALLFNQEKGFPDDYQKAFKMVKVPVKDNEVQIRVDNLPKDNYVISVIHDGNNNNRLDTHWYGKPKEGVGVSNNVKGRFGPPSYDKCLFSLNTDHQEIKISMYYP